LKPSFNGKKIKGELFDFSIRLDRSSTVLLLFFSISKKHFNAVKRNIIKRRIKEYLRVNVPLVFGELHFFIRRSFSLSDKMVLKQALDNSLVRIKEYC
jgi:ribonuclease P protein component